MLPQTPGSLLRPLTIIQKTKKWTELGEKQSLWDYVGKGTLCENSAKHVVLPAAVTPGE